MPMKKMFWLFGNSKKNISNSGRNVFVLKLYFDPKGYLISANERYFCNIQKRIFE